VVIGVGVPQYRVDICEEEFELISFAYETLIGPHIDPELAKKVYDRGLLPDENFNLPNSRR
jgi:hypothetical protein